jgi:glyoxylase-like metal-dependent hydrolase (beta-lactamase superfamily II)
MKRIMQVKLIDNIGYVVKYTAIMLLANMSLGHAGEVEDRIISKVVEAYGAEALTKAKSITIHDNYKLLYTGQGVSPNFTEINKKNVSFTIDFEKQRKSIISWESSGRGTRLNKTVFDGKKATVYDLYHNTYDENEHINFESMGASIERSHDTLLAHLAWISKSTVEYKGEIIHRGAPHDLLKLRMATGHELTLHVNRQTGLISRMTRANAHVGEIAYVFSNYKVTGGVTYAADLQVNVAGNPELFSTFRKIEINPSLVNVFDKALGFELRGEVIDTSEMSVEVLADGVYFAGQGHRFSLFVDVGEYFIAAGGNSGLHARFEAVKKKAGVDKPLKYQVVTHHHSDHLEGLNDVTKLGTSFITVSEHIASIQASLEENISEDRFILVNNKAKYSNGMVEVFNMPSTHSDQNLLIYIPKAKLMFTADHFSTDLKMGLPNADKGTVILRNEITRLNLGVERFLGAHGPRVLTISDLHKAVDSYSKGRCPKGITVCNK